jgi:hypothetical protein
MLWDEAKTWAGSLGNIARHIWWGITPEQEEGNKEMKVKFDSLHSPSD